MPEVIEYLDGRYGLLGLVVLGVAFLLYRRGFDEVFAAPPNEVVAVMRRMEKLHENQIVLHKDMLVQFEDNNSYFKTVAANSTEIKVLLTSLDQKAALLQGLMMAGGKR